MREGDLVHNEQQREADGDGEAHFHAVEEHAEKGSQPAQQVQLADLRDREANK